KAFEEVSRCPARFTVFLLHKTKDDLSLNMALLAALGIYAIVGFQLDGWNIVQKHFDLHQFIIEYRCFISHFGLHNRQRNAVVLQPSICECWRAEPCGS